MTTLLEASKALVARWDTPLWKDVPSTAEYINALRTAISEAEKVEPVATLHDDGYWTWKGTPPYASSFVGWKLDVYTAPQPSPKQEPDAAYEEAKQLAEWLFKTHYASEEDYASGRIVWQVCDTTAGVLSQIDNMVYPLVMPAPQPDPIATTGKMVQPLTCDEIDKAIQQHVDPVATYLGLHRFARAIEKAHGIGERRKPLTDSISWQFKKFREWSSDAGYDTAHTHDGVNWICLNPMTADLWKAWQAAHDLKEQP